MSDALLHALETEVDKLRGELIEAKSAITECQTRLAWLEAKECMRGNPYAILGDQRNHASIPLSGPWNYLKLDGA